MSEIQNGRLGLYGHMWHFRELGCEGLKASVISVYCEAADAISFVHSTCVCPNTDCGEPCWRWCWYFIVTDCVHNIHTLLLWSLTHVSFTYLLLIAGACAGTGQSVNSLCAVALCLQCSVEFPTIFPVDLSTAAHSVIAECCREQWPCV